MLRDKQPDKRYESQIRSILQEADTQRVQTGGWKRALGLRERDHCIEHLLNMELLLLMRHSALPRQMQFEDWDEY